MKRKIFFLVFFLIFSTSPFFAQPGGGRGPSGHGGPGGPGGSHSPSGPGAGRGGHSAPINPGNLNTSGTHSFNGMRLPSKHNPFQVVHIETTSEIILITFNIPINPSTCKRENIFINGKELDESSDFRYNKTGKILEIKTKLSVGTKFTLEFKNLKSYDQEELKVKKFESLLPWTSKEYSCKTSAPQGD